MKRPIEHESGCSLLAQEAEQVKLLKLLVSPDGIEPSTSD